jgi:hypothetical protein
MNYLTEGKYQYFFPYNTEMWCILKMTRDTIARQKSYDKFCKQNNFITSNGRNRITAEVVYRYINNDTSFVESHTGLEDVMIETQIMTKAFRQHKKMRKLMFSC